MVKLLQPPSTLEKLESFGLKAATTRQTTPGFAPEEEPCQALELPQRYLVPFCEEDLKEILGRHEFYASGPFAGPALPALSEGAPPEEALPEWLIRLEEEVWGQVEQGSAEVPEEQDGGGGAGAGVGEKTLGYGLYTH